MPPYSWINHWNPLHDRDSDFSIAMGNVWKLRNDAAHRLPVQDIRGDAAYAVKAAILFGDDAQGEKIQGLIDVWVAKEKAEGRDLDEKERWWRELLAT